MPPGFVGSGPGFGWKGWLELFQELQYQKLIAETYCPNTPRLLPASADNVSLGPVCIFLCIVCIIAS